MRYGFVKVCAATPKIKVADVDYNVNNIISAIIESAKKGSQITVFPELCLSGYTCGDLFNQTTLLKAVEAGLCRIKKATEGIKTLVFVGAPLRYSDRLYNCSVAISDGEIKGIVPKTYIPNYGEFYEKRHFNAGREECELVELCGDPVFMGTNLLFAAQNNPDLIVGVEICEDLWAPCSPSLKASQAGAKIIVNLSCSDETVGKAEYRKSLVNVQSAKLVCGYIYCDAGDGESTTDMVFAGHNIISENGITLAESKLFENGLTYGEIDVERLSTERQRMSSTYFADQNVDLSLFNTVWFEEAEGLNEIDRYFDATPFVPTDCEMLSQRAKLILNIQTKGLEKRLLHTGSKTAVIGISGGLDSSLALLVTRRAFVNLGLPLKNIIAVTMPGFGTTDRTKDNSLKLIELVGATGKIIPIADSVLQHFKDIDQPADKHDVTYENAQARMRTLILMDIANQTGGMVIGTGDLSELALGWATYNGDHMSMYGVNASVPKTLVKYLVRAEADEIGGELANTLYDVLATEISPELLPPDKNGNIAQKTEDLVGPYELHDFYLYNAIRWGFEPEKIKYMAIKAFKGKYSEEIVEKWLKTFYRRFFAQQFKRSCLPDGVKVGSIALSPRGDWRMPSDAVATLWLKWAEE
ncbi:MAG: NAD(+) synthase [Candidatus Coproplasma sp.]